MKNRLSLRRTSADDERGATMVEYGLLVAVIAILVMAGAALIGSSINDFFSTVVASL